MSAAPDQQPPVKGPGGGTPPRQDERDLWKLHQHGIPPLEGARIMGMPERRRAYLMGKWNRRGLLSLRDLGWQDMGWTTDEPEWAGRRIGAQDIRASSLNGSTPAMEKLTVRRLAPRPEPSTAMRVAMHGDPMDPVVREAVKKAAAAVSRRRYVAAQPAMARARAIADSIPVRRPRQVLGFDPALGGVTTHFTLFEDGQLVQNVQLGPRRPSHYDALMAQPMPTTRRGGIRYPSR